MADSLVLTGVKQVTKHTGTEMTRIDAKRGGNTHMLSRWWTQGNGAVYVACTVFKVEAGGATGYLAVEATGEGVSMKIIHDGSFNFEFQYLNEVSRAALYNDSMELVEHYVFPKVSGGKVMTVTPAGAADRPGGSPPGPSKTLTAVAISGNSASGVGMTETYNFTHTGTSSDVVYTFTSSEGGDEVTTVSAKQSTVKFNSDGARTLTLTGTSVQAGVSDNSIQDTKTVNVFVLTNVGNVTVTGEAAPTDGDTESYAATIDGDAGNLTYAWSVDGSGTISGASNQSSVSIDWSGTTASTVSCVVDSSDIGHNDGAQTGTLSVTPAAAPPATGPVTAVTLVGDTTTQTSGSVAATATTSANGAGLTVTYDSDGSTATNLAVAVAGSGYQEGDSFTVDGDTGVTGTVSIVVTSSTSSSSGGSSSGGGGGYSY